MQDYAEAVCAARELGSSDRVGLDLAGGRDSVVIAFGSVWPDGRIHFSHVELDGVRSLHRISRGAR